MQEAEACLQNDAIYAKLVPPASGPDLGMWLMFRRAQITWEVLPLLTIIVERSEKYFHPYFTYWETEAQGKEIFIRSPSAMWKGMHDHFKSSSRPGLDTVHLTGVHAPL